MTRIMDSQVIRRFPVAPIQRKPSWEFILVIREISGFSLFDPNVY